MDRGDGGDPACWLDEFGDWIDDVATLLSAAVAEALDADVVRTAPVTGGDVASAHRFDLSDGRRVFAKTHADPPSGFFTTEATGLGWLRQPGCVRVPEVLAVSDGENEHPPHLVLEWIDVGSSPAADATDFGRSLAHLHRAGLPSFGREDRRTTGSQGLPNEPCDDWASFYGTQRLAPLARLAHDAGALSDTAVAGLDHLADPDRLRAVGGPAEPPARLHGDLWAGNRVVDTSGSSWLIDPAAHGGHREFDLAMMDLFGGFSSACLEGYRDEAPLAEGWESRVALHQIAPLVVHAIKFGGAYRPAAERAIATYCR